MIIKTEAISLNPNIVIVYESHTAHESIDDSGMGDDLIESIESDFYSGNRAAWFDASITVYDSGIKSGDAWLCSCNYESFEQFLTDDYCSQLRDEALEASIKKYNKGDQ